MNLYEKMSVGFGPGFGAAPSKLFNLKPTDGTGDFNVVRDDANAPELITNGDFASGASWVFGVGWTLVSNKAVKDGSTGDLSQTGLGITGGEQYYVTLTTSGTYALGGLKVRLGAFVDLAAINSDGTHTFLVTAGGDNTTFALSVLNTGAFVGTVDDISIRAFSFNYAATRININGFIEGVRPNVPRSSYPIGGGTIGCPYLLTEPQRENLLLTSNDFTSGNWIKSRSSITDDDTTSPDGTVNADKLISDLTAANTHYTYQDVTLADSTTYCFSFFVKAAELDEVGITGKSKAGTFNTSVFNITTKTFSTAGGLDRGYEDYGNGWIRVWQTYASETGGTTPQVHIYLIEAGSFTFNGDGVSGFYVFGAVLEAGDYITNYIPTTTATITRQADQINNAGTVSNFNSVEGVISCNIAALKDDLTNRVLSISNGSSSNAITIYYSTSTETIKAYIIVGGVIQALLTHNSADVTEFENVAFRWKENNFTMWVNGGIVDSDFTGSSFAGGVLSELSFDDGGGSGDFYGKAFHLMVFDEYLTDAEMQYLTLNANFDFESGDAFLFN